MFWNLDDNKAIYQQLADEVRRRIITGVYPAGDYLPSVRDLAAEARVNPNTMQRALTQLESEGFLTTQRGNGRIISMTGEAILDEKRKVARQKLLACVEELRALGLEDQEIRALLRELLKGEE